MGDEIRKTGKVTLIQHVKYWSVSRINGKEETRFRNIKYYKYIYIHNVNNWLEEVKEEETLILKIPNLVVLNWVHHKPLELKRILGDHQIQPLYFINENMEAHRGRIPQ